MNATSRINNYGDQKEKNHSKRPAFQFYPGDYLSDMVVSLMTAEEEGHYIRLLCYCWVEGSLPNDDEQLAKLLKLNGGSCLVPPLVKGRFTVVHGNPSRLVHKRLEKERQKQEQWAEKSRIGGLKSAQARRDKELSYAKSGLRMVEQMVQPPYEPKGNSSSSSSSSITIPPTPLSKGGSDPTNHTVQSGSSGDRDRDINFSKLENQKPKPCMMPGCIGQARAGLPGKAALFCSETCYERAQRLDPGSFSTLKEPWS